MSQITDRHTQLYSAVTLYHCRLKILNQDSFQSEEVWYVKHWEKYLRIWNIVSVLAINFHVNKMTVYRPDIALKRHYLLPVSQHGEHCRWCCVCSCYQPLTMKGLADKFSSNGTSHVFHTLSANYCPISVKPRKHIEQSTHTGSYLTFAKGISGDLL